MSEEIKGTGTEEAAAPVENNAEPTAEEVKAPELQTDDGDGGGGEGEVSIIKDGLLTAGAEPKNSGDSVKEDGDPDVKAEITYEDFKLVEGLQADEEFLGTAKNKFAELGLTQQQAQELIDLQNQLMLKQDKTLMKEVDRQTQELVQKWEDEVRADEELGGADLGAKIAIAKSAATALECEEVIEVFKRANLASNPAVIRFMYRAGKALGEGKYVVGNQPPKTDKALTEVLYDKSNMK